METPSQKLAGRIIDKLIAAELLSADQKAKLLSKIAEGKMKPEDWRLPLELAKGKEAKK